MNRNALPFLLLLASFFWGASSVEAQVNYAKIDQPLIDLMANDPSEYQPILLLLEDQVDAASLHQDFTRRQVSLHERQTTLVAALQNKAARTQPQLLEQVRQQPGVLTSSIASLWVTNAISVQANAAAIEAFSNLPGVSVVVYLAPDKFHSVESTAAAPLPNGRENGLVALNADKMWAMGYTGANRKVLIIDTGVDSDHPALSQNYLGRIATPQESWFGPSTSNRAFDCGDHGTHVAGSAAGLDRNTNDTIGVAFNAWWMGGTFPLVDPITGQIPASCQTNTNSIQVLQWALNPDGDVNTTDDIPDAINNSWGGDGNCSSWGQYNTYVNLLTNFEAAGVAVIWSAGNDGPGVSTVNLQASINVSPIKSFSVGAVNGHSGSTPIGGFSSRGPSTCPDNGAQLAIKPEIVASGVNIRSALPGGGYQTISGTSMASPHVTGAVALLKEAYPNVTGPTILEAMLASAVDLGTTGEDNTYGKGLLDIKAAFDTLQAWGNTPMAVPTANVGIVAIADDETNICDNSYIGSITVENTGSDIVTSVELDYAYDGVSMSHTWNGSIAPGATEMILLPAQALNQGQHTLDVAIVNTNGAADYLQLDNFASASFTNFGEISLNVPDTLSSCLTGAVWVTGSTSDSNAIVTWYDAPTGGNILGADAFLMDNIIGDQTIYGQTTYNSQVGKADNTGSQGFYTQTKDAGIVFSAAVPMTLRSFKLYGALGGDQYFEIRDADGTVLSSAGPINVPAGEQVVNLDLEIPVGEDMRLALTNASAGGLYYNISDPGFPFLQNGYLTIESGFAGSTVSNDYYFFYDMVVTYDVGCVREPTLVMPISGGFNQTTFDADKSSIDLDTESPEVSFTDQTLGATDWEWDFGDGTTSTDQNPVHGYYQAGTYLVSLKTTTSNGTTCSDVDTMTINVTGTFNGTVSIEEEIADLGSIEMFPNPTSGIFQIQFDLMESHSGSIEVFDLVGNTVQVLGQVQAHHNNLQLDLSQVADGIYYVRINLGAHQVVKKLVKTH
ncbi:S8 family serine peptidase [Pontibacter sp. G13]|uniref:S8 family serine peptidase n=1 Tax=Pontibacter sp. G13 TaxID=3074898 RepID=UPI00288BE96E|nr:S8 family serine peptidase [Pontibacter sp. G13]WNJ21207.1 S8 family serine peptidase [Pontibacter sp. G13]